MSEKSAPRNYLKNRSRPPIPPLMKTISHNNLTRDFKSAHVQDQKMNFKDYAFLQYSSVVFVFCFDMRGTPVFDLTLVQIQSCSYILSRVVLRTLWNKLHIITRVAYSHIFLVLLTSYVDNLTNGM